MVIERGAASSAPRLRDAALVGRFARDPARWYDSLVMRRDEGATLVTRAIEFGRGSASEGQPPVPASGADWTAWRRWWDAGGGDHSGSFRALRFYEARTGRDPIAELAAAWPPEGDPARVALGEILRAAHAIPPPTADEVRTGVLSGDSVQVRRAAGQIQWGAGERVDADSVASVLVPLLDSIFADGSFPWPVVAGAPAEPSLQDGYATSSHGVGGIPTFLLEANIPNSIRANPPPDVTVITREVWQARDLRAGGHLFEFTRPRRWGPFLSLAWEWTALSMRTPDEAPKGYAGGATLILVQTDDGWRVVSLASWIT
jgi:hypothetical protein